MCSICLIIMSDDIVFGVFGMLDVIDVIDDCD